MWCGLAGGHVSLVLGFEVLNNLNHIQFAVSLTHD